MEALTKEKVLNLFELAGFKVEAIFTLENNYWPNAECFYKLRALNPWFLVKTKFGLIQIGPRKKVYSLNWEHTPLREKLPVKEGEEWITSEATCAHSWDLPALLTNLSNLRKALEGADASNSAQAALF